jgi:hypothetical protein
VADTRRGVGRAPRRRWLSPATKQHRVTTDSRHPSDRGEGVGRRPRAAIAVPARPPGEPPRRQPRSPRRSARHFQALESPATPRCDDRLSSGHQRRLIRRPTAPIVAVIARDRRQIQLGHRVQHRPHQTPPPGTQSHSDGGNKNTRSRPQPMNLAPIPARLPSRPDELPDSVRRGHCAATDDG